MAKLEYLFTAYMECLPTERYILRLVDSLEERKTQPRVYSPQQLWKSIGYLKYMNFTTTCNPPNLYHIYGRPEGYQFVLIDDIPRNRLNQLMELKPALVMETSPNNFQAFLHLSYSPHSREEAAQVCREVCHLLDADPGSAEPDHVGRLPGFLNLKPAYKEKYGCFPQVILHYARDQRSPYRPQGPKAAGPVGNRSKAHPSNKRAFDRSARDFAEAMNMLEKSCDETEIFSKLINSEKGKERGEKYVWQTIKNAKKKFEKHRKN